MASLSQPCPKCKTMNRPFQADVRDSFTVVYKYWCYGCHLTYTWTHESVKGVKFTLASEVKRDTHGAQTRTS